MWLTAVALSSVGGRSRRCGRAGWFEGFGSQEKLREEAVRDPAVGDFLAADSSRLVDLLAGLAAVAPEAGQQHTERPSAQVFSFFIS